MNDPLNEAQARVIERANALANVLQMQLEAAETTLELKKSMDKAQQDVGLAKAEFEKRAAEIVIVIRQLGALLPGQIVNGVAEKVAADVKSVVPDALKALEGASNEALLSAQAIKNSAGVQLRQLAFWALGAGAFGGALSSCLVLYFSR